MRGGAAPAGACAARPGRRFRSPAGPRFPCPKARTTCSNARRPENLRKLPAMTQPSLAGLLAVLAAAVVVPAAHAAESVGRSADGRAITATRIGAANAPIRILVVGSIHGDEPAGHRVIRTLRRSSPPDGVQLWLVRTANPDGAARRTRQNARGVDLNRNFPRRWRGGGRPFDTFFPGRRAASEPETRAVQRLVQRIRPQRTVWFHQALRLVNYSPGADRAVVRAYARRVGLPARSLGDLRGTATSWQNHAHPGTSAFVVELPGGPLVAAGARRHARAVLGLAGDASRAATATAAAAPRPRIVSKSIPFPAVRKRQMRAYARRHYGISDYHLNDPKVIVEHMTATSAFGPVFNTFASNAPDPELGERPGTCSHFVVDTDGTIYQLVSIKLMCRHTVGLNYTSIGIEHVGLSDGALLGSPDQLAASLRLTRWLQGREGIATGDVIGHAESLSSPYHRERVERLKRQTHGDMSGRTMRRYRARLGGG